MKVALIGNPNTGKTSLFNQLTGLNQKVGNYPGITVSKKTGSCKLSATESATIIDLPGTYSITPSSLDEAIVLDTLVDTKNKAYPDVIVVVSEVENLKRNLYLFSQVKDLEIPTILAINMADQLENKGISIDVAMLEKELNTKIVLISAKKNQGIDELKKTMLDYQNISTKPLEEISKRMDTDFFEKLKNENPKIALYTLWLLISQEFLPEKTKNEYQSLIDSYKSEKAKIKKLQQKETIYRYQFINDILKKTYVVDKSKASGIQAKLDRILTHKIFGYVIFFLILALIFQSIFSWSSIPMDFIDAQTTNLADFITSKLPAGAFTDLITQGVIPGIGGIVIFIPQIVILFLFVSLLEETGYMSRVVFLMDKIMRKFGMSGKSVVPLISGTACAIPAIMAARNINGWKERLITILVTPFTTCSARLPVYTIIIALIIPETEILGIFNLQGFVLLGMYLLGFLMAIVSAYILHKIMKVKAKNFFIIEMPTYKLPLLKNIGITVIEKTKAFVWGAGKIILAISIVLWFLASNGGEKFKNAEQIVKDKYANTHVSEEQLQNDISSYQLEHSYIGQMGKAIEPVIRPLGYDWKIGIALISSFAAREVFVGTLATIYSIGNDTDDETTIKERMNAEINPDTGKKRFDFPTGMSLLVFYAFAMQCMGTLAIVKKETNSWKWPLVQLFGMGAIAYVSSFLVYTFLS
ncbi:ferrous iron transport protein B [Aureivirga marina]|uniref:ferrous iron transport protein B n=1 Tax=Aureivirga marina TaxID=1182451 RepID=UPI0018CA99D4|nr:ferrous iron transport protein B [Aureivirga marina]